jgi:hypothetical protein
MDPIAVKLSVAQASLFRRIGITIKAFYNKYQKVYVVEMYDPKNKLICVGTDKDERNVVDVAVDGYVSIFGEKLPELKLTGPAPIAAPNAAPRPESPAQRLLKRQAVLTGQDAIAALRKTADTAARLAEEAIAAETARLKKEAEAAEKAVAAPVESP